jgi:hypothetical protein
MRSPGLTGEQARLEVNDPSEKDGGASFGALTTFSRRSSPHDRWEEHNSTPASALACGSPPIIGADPGPSHTSSRPVMKGHVSR